jgi:hypothetical protein
MKSQTPKVQIPKSSGTIREFSPAVDFLTSLAFGILGFGFFGAPS